MCKVGLLHPPRLPLNKADNLAEENNSIALQGTVLTEKLTSSRGKYYFYLLVFCSSRPQYAPAKVQLSHWQLLSVQLLA